MKCVVLSTLSSDMIEPKQMDSSFEFLRAWFLGRSSWRGWGLWNISPPNYLQLKRLLWAALPDSQARFALALLCCLGSSRRHSLAILSAICRQLRVIYPEEWSKLGEKSVSCYGKACFSQVRVLFFKPLKIVKINISFGCFFFLKSRNCRSSGHADKHYI